MSKLPSASKAEILVWEGEGGKSRPLGPHVRGRAKLKRRRSEPSSKLSVPERQDLENVNNSNFDETNLDDPNFHTELIYDGYKSVEEYDNDVYNRALMRDDDLDDELDIVDREANPNSGEENLVDPQENRS